jgi:AraC-like DNA-binding protein
MLNYYAELNKLKLLYILTFNIADVVSIAIGPFLYLYVKSLFEDKEVIKKNLIHFIYPTAYLIIFSIPVLIFSRTKIRLIPFIEKVMNVNRIVYVYEDIYLIIYLIVTLFLLKKYNNVTKSIYSNLKNKELLWVKYLLLGALIITVVDIFTFIYDFNYPDTNFESDFVTVILVVIFLYFLGYYGIKQSKILVPEFLLNPVKNNKISTSLINMDSIEIKQHISKINTVLTNKELFLDEDLTLNKLAKETSLSDKKLSTIINQEMDTSFYDLINSYRLEEFKKRVISKEFDNLTILGIAYDCGFKTKSTFNRLFKLQTGISPSEFKKNYKTQIS